MVFSSMESALLGSLLCSVVLETSFHLSASLFPHLKNRNDNSTYLTELLRGSNERIFVENLGQCWAGSKHFTGVCQIHQGHCVIYKGVRA